MTTEERLHIYKYSISESLSKLYPQSSSSLPGAIDALNVVYEQFQGQNLGASDLASEVIIKVGERVGIKGIAALILTEKGSPGQRLKLWQDESISPAIRKALGVVVEKGRDGIEYNQGLIFAEGQRLSTISVCQKNIDELRRLKTELLKEVSPSNVSKQ